MQTVANEARDGDLVVVMSNGGFDGIHGKLLDGAREAAGSPMDRQAFDGCGPALLGGERLRPDAPLAPLTTFRVGGRADWLADVRTADELQALVAAAAAAGVPVTVLGGGSNVVVADDGIRGLVVRAAADDDEPAVVERGASGCRRDDQRARAVDDWARAGRPGGLGRYARARSEAPFTATLTGVAATSAIWSNA